MDRLLVSLRSNFCAIRDMLGSFYTVDATVRHDCGRPKVIFVTLRLMAARERGENAMKIQIVIGLMLVIAFGPIRMAQTGEFVHAPNRAVTGKLKVAIFVFPGVQVIDFTGPFEVFLQSGSNVYAVGERMPPSRQQVA